MTDAELREVARLLHGRPQAGEGSALHHRRDVQSQSRWISATRCSPPARSSKPRRSRTRTTPPPASPLKPRTPAEESPQPKQAATPSLDLQPHQTILKDNQTGSLLPSTVCGLLERRQQHHFAGSLHPDAPPIPEPAGVLLDAAPTTKTRRTNWPWKWSPGTTRSTSRCR